MKKRFIFICFFYFFAGIRSHAQLLPPNQPEQDACNALQLCGNRFFTPFSYQKTGAKNDMPSTPCGSSEANSVWLKLVVNEAGSIVFSIIPVDPTDDYDYAIIDLTGKDCNKIGSADVIRCNFNNNSQPNTYYPDGIVGLNATSAIQFVQSGTSGMPFLQQIAASAGDVYLIMINNFGGSGGPSSGFTIDFSGSSAVFQGDGTPEYDSLDISCGTTNNVNIYMNTPIQCSSIAGDGSDFKIIPSLATVNGAAGSNCTGANGYTQEIALSFSNPVPSGNYILVPNRGSDGNTLIDLCNEEQLLSDSIHFEVINPLVDLGPDTTTCINNSLQLHANIDGQKGSYNIVWSPNQFLNNNTIDNPVSTPLEDLTYIVTVTSVNRPECFTKDTLNIRVLQGFDLLNTDTMICKGDSLALNIKGDDRYFYQWEPPAGLNNPTMPNTMAAPDTTTKYTLTASYPGCRDSAQFVTIDVEDGSSVIKFVTDRNSLCIGGIVHFVPQTEGGNPKLLWDFGDEAFIDTNVAVQHAYDHAGAMVVELKTFFQVCPEISAFDTVTVFPFPLVKLSRDTFLCLNQQPILLYNLAANPPGIYSYLWNTGDTTQRLNVVEPGNYTLTVTTGQGCSTTEQVEVKENCYIDIPNAFTPNNDGSNDYFFPRQFLSKNLSSFKMQVFNRWGQKVFETEKADGRGWDGNFNDKPQPEGVYIYIIDAQVDGLHTERYQGNVTLIR